MTEPNKSDVPLDMCVLCVPLLLEPCAAAYPHDHWNNAKTSPNVRIGMSASSDGVVFRWEWYTRITSVLRIIFRAGSLWNGQRMHEEVSYPLLP